jgi:MFS family permease
LAGELIALFCLGKLENEVFYYGFILGNGITSGTYNVLMAVTWPRFYGRENLGKITGFVMSLVVFASALGPILLSFVFSWSGSYKFAFWGLAIFVLIIAFFSSRADNPQDKFTTLQ